MNKVVNVAGDFENEEIGLKEDDRAVLVRDVNEIFHCAATVHFDAKLSSAISINILGTKYMLDLAREMPHLKVSHKILLLILYHLL
jgi:fatty acyl-CoA reductase